MIKKILYLAFLSAISTMSFAQDTSIPKFNQDFKVSAQIDAGCFLEADNINFGNLITPISSQSASSNMRIHCSKGAPLKIGISYSGTSQISSNFTYSVVSSNGVTFTYYKIQENGVNISSSTYDFECWSGSIVYHSQEAANFFGVGQLYTGLKNTLPDTLGLCNYNKVIPSKFESFGYVSVGSLTGVAKGEIIKYSLELPNSSSTLWAGNNTYNISGTGVQQTIPMKANITSSGNPTHRMSPDTYTGTLTVILTY